MCKKVLYAPFGPGFRLWPGLWGNLVLYIRFQAPFPDPKPIVSVALKEKNCLNYIHNRYLLENMDETKKIKLKVIQNHSTEISTINILPYSQLSMSSSCAWIDSTNWGSKIFRKKIPECSKKTTLEFA